MAVSQHVGVGSVTSMPRPAPPSDFDELADWGKVYEEFLATKKQLRGEADASNLTSRQVLQGHAPAQQGRARELATIARG